MRKWPLIKSKTCAHDDDDPGSEKLAVSRERAAPWLISFAEDPLKKFRKQNQKKQHNRMIFIQKTPAIYLKHDHFIINDNEILGNDIAQQDIVLYKYNHNVLLGRTTSRRDMSCDLT
ncbi:hypothetical protein [Enterobacter sp. R-25]|uniref:hypothetical protein n=1 Tax=Enterobacter sp. R-25 TaxID=3404057 RepID=UPI003CF4F098